jgi:anti-anti-sigma factor
VNGLELDVEFLAERVVVEVTGELDILTAAVFAGVLNALVDDEHRDLVVDMSGVTFIGAAGLGVFARVVSRLSEIGGAITVRSAPERVRRVFDIAGMSDLVAGASSEPSMPQRADAHDDARPVDGDGPESVLAASGSGALSRSSTDVVDAALRLVTALTASTVENADGVSVTLERHGRLMTAAASDDAVKVMDGHQYDTGEGPCLSAKADGRWYYIESLAEEARWPKFVPLALEQGIHSILSSPLMTKERPQGALNIYSSKERAFSSRDQELAALFSEQASEILTTAGPVETDEQAKQRFASALAARMVIHQAQGVIMERDGLAAEVALRALHRDARAADVTLLRHATEVIASVGADGKAKGHA